MRVTRLSTLALVILGGGAVTGIALIVMQSFGSVPPAVSWSVGAVLAVGALGLLALGWPVRQYTRGKRRDVDALRAARVLALAKACALVGAFLTGGYVVLLGYSLRQLTSPVLQERAWSAGGAALGAALVMIAAVIVEYFCRIPPESHDEEEEGAGSSSGPREPRPA